MNCTHTKEKESEIYHLRAPAITDTPNKPSSLSQPALLVFNLLASRHNLDRIYIKTLDIRNNVKQSFKPIIVHAILKANDRLEQRAATIRFKRI